MASDNRKKGQKNKSDLTPQQWLLLVGIASAIGLMMGAAMVAISIMSVSRLQEAQSINMKDPEGIERRTKGKADAPIVITEWYDYQCPACARYALTREPEFERRFVDTGMVKIIYKNLPFLGQESIWAAEAAECAADQGRYWDYRNLLFRRQQGENKGGFSKERLKSFAAELGLDQAKFNESLDNDVHLATIKAEIDEADKLGVEATPTFFVNGRMIDGIPTNDEFQKIIEEELAKKR